MSESTWDQVRRHFEAVLPLAPEERSVYLSRECGDSDVAQEVLALIEEHEGAPDTAAVEAVAAQAFVTSTASHVESEDSLPRQIGGFRVVEKIGEGGMGVIYLAEQEEPIRRRVALKVVRSDLSAKEVLSRFEAERQALAVMNHSGIARIYDAATTEDGRPYFVMEHVAGEPLNRFCDREQLTIRQRLEIFVQVCDAVQHAHQKGVIHRDLKPSNLLVAREGERTVAKVIDFGVAKSTALRLTEQTLFTRFGAIVGTPEYMSPEQAEGGGERHRYALRCLLPRRRALRDPGRATALRVGVLASSGLCRDAARDPGGGSTDTVNATHGRGRDLGDHRP